MRLADLNGADCAADEQEGRRQRHLRFIEALAEEMHCQVQDVSALYEEVLASLSSAKVEDYVPIFVCRRVRRILSGSRVSF